MELHPNKMDSFRTDISQFYDHTGPMPESYIFSVNMDLINDIFIYFCFSKTVKFSEI